MKTKSVSYFRVSTIRQGESGLGLDGQRDVVRRFVTLHGMESVGEFTEVESGKKTDAERPQLSDALALCKKQGATLIVSKLDRLSRNALFLLQLQQANVDFICCDCPNVDRFTVGILALVAQRERELISERTKSALAQARKRGVRLGTKNPNRQVKLMMEGYQRDRQSFLNRVSPIVQEIKSSGVTTLTEIALCLTRRGIPTRNGKSVWFPSTVKTVVGREIFRTK
ncbi:MAG TPA: recombinase family protein [Lacunisphaera sp.]|jgi:DNA invertase Pin-like site-specific DNA recombinase